MPGEYELDSSIGEKDFRAIARQRLARQDQDFQNKWLPLINDTDSRGRLMGYTAVWTAMDVRDNWMHKPVQPELAGNIQNEGST